MVTPIVVGTSVLTPKGGRLTAPASNSLLGLTTPQNATVPSVPGPLPGAPDPLTALLAGNAGTSVNPNSNDPLAKLIKAIGDAQASANAPTSVAPGVRRTNQVEGLPVNESPATKAGKTVNAFAAAIKLARGIIGGFDASPYNIAAGEAQSQAGTQKAEATKLANQTEDDDAALYGRLGNSIKNTAEAGRRGTRQTAKSVENTYSGADKTIKGIYNQSNASTNAALGKLGISGSSAGTLGQEDENFLRGENASNSANSRGNVKSAGRGFNDLMKETRGDVAATGAGYVAGEKSALNQTLASIASALSSQLATVHEGLASAHASHASQIHAAAASLLQQEMTANSPAAKLKLAIERAELGNDKGNEALKARALEAPPSGEDDYTKALSAINSAGLGNQTSAVQHLLELAESGQLLPNSPIKDTSSSGRSEPFTGLSNNLGVTLQQLQQVYASNPSLSPASRNTLEQAIHILAGK